MITTIDILGVPYTVKTVDDIDDGARSADVTYHTAEIRLANGATPHMQRVILLHEIVHGMFEVEGHDEYRADENLTKAVSYGMVYLLRHNPDLVKYLTEGGAI